MQSTTSFRRFDYTGITVLIVASFVPPIYYAFLCEPFWRIFYLVTTCMLGECSSPRPQLANHLGGQGGWHRQGMCTLGCETCDGPLCGRPPVWVACAHLDVCA